MAKWREKNKREKKKKKEKILLEIKEALQLAENKRYLVVKL